MANAKEYIESGRTALGIEFGSTRIKAILVDENNTPIASGSHEWENQHINGIWTRSARDCRIVTRRWRQTSKRNTA